jgi:hypothetical protein
MEGTGPDLIEVWAKYSARRTEESNEKYSQDKWCPGRDVNWAPPEYKSRMLPPHQPVRTSRVLRRGKNNLSHVDFTAQGSY